MKANMYIQLIVGLFIISCIIIGEKILIIDKAYYESLIKVIK